MCTRLNLHVGVVSRGEGGAMFYEWSSTPPPLEIPLYLCL